MISPKRSKPPPFHELDGGEFEELCCALLDKQPGILQADLHGVPRQTQFGVDIIAKRESREDIDVASCKCKDRLRKGDLAKFSDEFLSHWDSYWHDKNVQRFVLCVAVDVKSHQRQAEIKAEEKRFRAKGLVYEVWAPRQLQELLRPHPGIVSQFLGEHFVPLLCGTVRADAAPPPTAQALIESAMVANLAAVQSALSDEIDARLSSARDALRRGRRDEVARELSRIRSDDAYWRSLAPTVQARLLRLQAIVNLGGGLVEEAEKLADGADAISPAEDNRLRALLMHQRSGAQAALDVLGEPTTRDGTNLRAALLLEVRNPSGALNLLKDTEEDEDAEAWRLRAYGRLMGGDYEEAQQAISKAERLAPDWLVVQKAAAIIRYAFALSPCIAFVPSAWPEPVRLDLVRQDDDSREGLRQAERLFAGLVDRESNQEEQHGLEIWRLGCLANDQERSSEAQDYCKHLIRNDRTNPGAITWALARGYQFDRSRSVKSLESLLESGTAGVEHLLTLVGIHLDSGNTEKAATALSRHEAKFAEETEKPLLTRWRVLIAAEQNELPSSKIRDSVGPWAELLAIGKSSQVDGRWERLVEFMERHANDPALIYAAATMLANAGRRTEIAPYTSLLVDKVSTADAIGLAAIALFESGDPTASLAVLQDHSSDFPNGQLPLNLRRLQVAANRKVGDLRVAGRLAKEIASETQSASDLLTLIHAKVEAGDLRGTIPHIRKAMAGQLSVEDAVQLSAVVRHEDPSLAKTLLETADIRALPSGLTPLAFQLSLEFGLHEKSKPLHSMLDAVARDSSDQSVQRVSTEEVAEFMRRHRDREEELTEIYLTGNVPVHLVMSAGNANLGSFYWRSFELASNHPTLAMLPVLVQHGSRRMPEAFSVPIDNWALHLDVTALLVSSQLDLLDALEALPERITIPHALPAVLLEMEHDARPRQPHRIAALKAIMSELDAKRIWSVSGVDQTQTENRAHDKAAARLARRLEWAEEFEGLIVDFDDSPNRTPDVHSERIINLRAVAESVRALDALDLEQFQRSLGRLGIYGQQAPRCQLQKGQALLFHANTIELLTEAGLLVPAIRQFNVFVEDWYIERERIHVANADEGDRTAEWLRQIRVRLAEGIENDIYTVLPHRPELIEEVLNGSDTAPGIDHCLLELLAIPPEKEAVVWADDRHVTAFSNTNGHPIVGVVEVLAALAASQRISKDQFFKANLRLREARAAFLPIPAEEVLYHLARASIAKNEVVETSALRTLKRSASELLLLEKHLDLLPEEQRTDGLHPEMWCLVRAHRLASDTILAIWQQDSLGLTQKKALSRWVWKSLRVERFSRLPIQQDTVEGRKFLWAVNLASLLSSAIQLSSKGDGNEEPLRVNYLNWVFEDLCGDAFEVDPGLLKAVGDALRRLHISLLEPEEDDDVLDDDLGVPRREVKKALIQGLVETLPAPVKDAVLDDRNFRHELGMEIVSVVEIQGRSFRRDTFWGALERALTSGYESVPSHDGSQDLEVFRLGEDKAAPAFEFRGALNGKYTDPELGLLAPGVESRVHCLRGHPYWLDYPAQELETHIKRIAHIESSSERMTALAIARKESAAEGYSSLASMLAADEGPPWSAFRPTSVDALVRFLRLDPDPEKDFETTLRDSAESLVRELGPIEAFRRLAGLPMAMPRPVVDALGKLAGINANAVRQELTSRSGGPLTRLHRISVARYLFENADLPRTETGTSLADIRRSVESLLQEWPGAGEAFLAVLKWTNRVLKRDASWRELPAAVRLGLVWTHSERITSTLLDAGAASETIRKRFDRQDPLLVEYSFQVDTLYESSDAHPLSMSADVLLLHTLGMAVGPNEERVLTKRLRRQLRHLVTMTADGKPVPLPLLFQDRRSAQTKMGTVFVQRPIDLMTAVTDAETPSQLGWNKEDEFVEHAIKAVEDFPNLQDGWLRLFMLDVPCMTKDTLKRAVEAGLKARLKDAYEADSRAGLMLCRILAEIAVWSGDDRLRSHVEGGFEGIAEHLASKYSRSMHLSQPSNEDSGVSAAFELFDVALVLSRRADAKEGADVFAGVMERIADKWPSTIPLMVDMFDSILRQLPFECGESTWKLFVLLRANSGPD